MPRRKDNGDVPSFPLTTNHCENYSLRLDARKWPRPKEKEAGAVGGSF